MYFVCMHHYMCTNYLLLGTVGWRPSPLYLNKVIIILLYMVMNSQRDNFVHTAESPDPVIQIKSIYAYIMNIQVPRMVVT